MQLKSCSRVSMWWSTASAKGSPSAPPSGTPTMASPSLRLNLTNTRWVQWPFLQSILWWVLWEQYLDRGMIKLWIYPSSTNRCKSQFCISRRALSSPSTPFQVLCRCEIKTNLSPVLRCSPCGPKMFKYRGGEKQYVWNVTFQKIFFYRQWNNTQDI